METLDPRVHDPEEYEGKGVTIGGCPYEVGALVGSGASKFVHLLTDGFRMISAVASNR